MRTKWVWVLVLLVAATAVSCGLSTAGQEAAAPSPAVDQGSGPPASDLPEGLPFGQNAQWPDTIPADIPVLEGPIQMVMGSPESNLRLFYGPLTEEQIERFLAQCDQAGFEIEYIVYVPEGFPDKSDEKLKAGEYDAVDLTRGDYRLRLEAGPDLATLDIHVAGLPSAAGQARPSATPLGWPADILAAVPQPEGCAVRSIANLSYGGYQIACEYADGDIRLEGYRQTLLGLGFEENDRLISDTDEIVSITLGTGDWAVVLLPHSLSSTLTLQVTPAGS